MDSILGMLIFCGGGLAGATFLLPARGVKGWAYETWWMFYCVVGLLLMPTIVCAITVPNFCGVIASAPGATLLKCVAFGAIWGVGGLTWGLMVRYLGIGLGLGLQAQHIMAIIIATHMIRGKNIISKIIPIAKPTASEYISLDASISTFDIFSEGLTTKHMYFVVERLAFLPYFRVFFVKIVFLL